MSTPLHSRLLTSLAEIAELEAEWRALLQESRLGTPFLTWEWVTSWLECFTDRTQPWVITIRDPGGRLLGIAPFVRRQRRWRGVPFREVAFIGTGRAAPDHLDLIAAARQEEAVAAAVVRHLRRARLRFEMLYLDGVRHDSPFVTMLTRDVPRRYHLLEESPCPYVRLPGSWEEYFAQRTADVRKRWHRQARRLAAYEGTAEYRLVDDEPSLEGALESLISFQSSAFSGSGSGAFTDTRHKAFHRLAAHRLLQAGCLRFYVLLIDGQIAAALYGLSYRGCFWSYIGAFDRKWARYSVGRQLDAYTVRTAIEEGLREFDFLRGSEAYKFEWVDSMRRDLILTVALRPDVQALLALWNFKSKMASKTAPTSETACL
jgi:CelD/BcsL family acetyltransferase involved in cellulose biosynthesis